MVSSVVGVLWWRVGRLQRCCVTMFAFVVFTIVRELGGQIPVQRYVALVHAQVMCLRCVGVVLEALLAWRGDLVAQRFSWFCPNFGWLGLQFEQRSVFLLVLSNFFFWSKWFSLPLFLIVSVVVRPLLESFWLFFVIVYCLLFCLPQVNVQSKINLII